MSAADPVSWLVIERGWTVTAADGTEVGHIDQTVGDSTRGIFNGLTISHGLFSTPRYVPAEQVAEIVEGSVRLALTPDEVERLEEYEEPGTTAEILPPDRES